MATQMTDTVVLIHMGKTICSERAVEYPFVFMNLRLEEGARILDVGCVGSLLSYKLSSMGYKVTGYDLGEFDVTHPNLTFIQGDFLDNEFRDGAFDAVVAISTVEHCGIPVYGSRVMEDGDRRMVREIHRVLKGGGVFIMSVPFGKKGKNKEWRVYDERALDELLKDFTIEKIGFFVGMDRSSWSPVDLDKIREVDSASKGIVQGVACVVCKKIQKEVEEVGRS